MHPSITTLWQTKPNQQTGKLSLKLSSERGLGVKKARWMNVSLLGKLVWQLINNQEKLWARILRSNRYLGNSNVLTATINRGDSYTWHSIMRALIML